MPNNTRSFAYENDRYYPLNHWRAKHGINYEAVNNIFGKVVGDLLDENHTIRGAVQYDAKPDKSKQSQATRYFEEGKHFITLTNEQRYYYGLTDLENSWDKITRFSTTHNHYKRTEMYFEKDILKKVIYEKVNVINDRKNIKYLEADINTPTRNRAFILPKTSRGSEQKLNPSTLLTPTYMRENLIVYLQNPPNENSVYSFNCSNDQYLPLPPEAFKDDKDFQEYTKQYISELPDDYSYVLDNFHNKKRTTVNCKSGDIFRVQLTPTTYTYGLILCHMRDFLEHVNIPNKHPIGHLMCQPVMFRQYDIVTTDKNMTADMLRNVPLRAVDIAQDNDIHWETYPIVAHKSLEENDVDFPFEYVDGNVYWGLGMHQFGKDYFKDLEYDKILAFGTCLSIICSATPSEAELRNARVLSQIINQIGLDEENAIDEFARLYGGITRAEFAQLIKENDLDSDKSTKRSKTKKM